MPRHPSLRTVLIIAATLAGAKVWASDRYHRAIYSEALIAAYGEKARLSCQKELGRLDKGYSSVRLSTSGVVIGSSATRVALWDVDNPLWEVRYRHPHVLMTADAFTDVRCAFDVTAGLASVQTEASAE